MTVLEGTIEGERRKAKKRSTMIHDVMIGGYKGAKEQVGQEQLERTVVFRTMPIRKHHKIIDSSGKRFH